jgi:hypothetical protein
MDGSSFFACPESSSAINGGFADAIVAKKYL